MLCPETEVGQGQEGLALRGGLGAGVTNEVVILGREEWNGKVALLHGGNGGREEGSGAAATVIQDKR